MFDYDSLYFHVTKEYKTNFSFNCNSSVVVYLFDYVVWFFSMWIALARLLGLGLTSTRRAIIGSQKVLGHQFPDGHLQTFL